VKGRLDWFDIVAGRAGMQWRGQDEYAEEMTGIDRSKGTGGTFSLYMRRYYILNASCHRPDFQPVDPGEQLGPGRDRFKGSVCSRWSSRACECLCRLPHAKGQKAKHQLLDSVVR